MDDCSGTNPLFCFHGLRVSMLRLLCESSREKAHFVLKFLILLHTSVFCELFSSKARPWANAPRK